ncbi:MAG: hypothetical protein ACJ72P_03445 [Nocardioides sp.]
MGGQLVNELVASGFLDGSDLHDGVSPSEDLCGLRKRVVVVAGDHEEPGRCSTVSAKGPSVIIGFDFDPRLIVRALLLWASPAPPVMAPPRALSNWTNSESVSKVAS